jgi:hypothetical protein
VKVFSRLPDVTVRVANDVKLMGVIGLFDLGTRRRSVWVNKGREQGDERDIFLVIKTCLFLWSERTRSRVGRRGTRTSRSQMGLSGYQEGARRRGSNVVRGGRGTSGRRRRAFLLFRDRGVARVRFVAEGRCGRKVRWRQS